MYKVVKNGEVLKSCNSLNQAELFRKIYGGKIYIKVYSYKK